ncbi:hypothetical protein [Chitinophaga sp. XS-30]|uniref:hypothetical protein n=1 Tax=Chitinophaga sp. XS-30 TaxID=2604421 RepID=UPI00143D477B|nr:hypothetical protein [Chitinophaga sp. XS-30]
MKIISAHIPIDKNDIFAIEQHLYKYLDDHVDLPTGIRSTVFPDRFTEEKMHLIMPVFFFKAFGLKFNSFVQDVSIGGFFYFKYLLCLDLLADQDSLINNKKLSQATLLQSHIYHEEAMKILGKLLGGNHAFWATWSIRTKELMASIMQDKQYNINMSFADYEKLCIRKCSFYKAAVDVFYHKVSSGKNEGAAEIYRDLISLIDHFSIARCIQDDIEDVVKDLQFSKNNICHIELNKSLSERGLFFSMCNADNIQSLCIGTGTFEKALDLSIAYYRKALLVCKKYSSKLDKLETLLNGMLNTLSLYLVQIKAYRIDKIIRRGAPAAPSCGKYDVHSGRQTALEYIRDKQFADGSWNDVMNKQGLSNVWATGFISIFNDEPAMLDAAGKFLINNTHNGLWGYNNDWTFDYDSSTCSLIAIAKAGYAPLSSGALGLWAGGQNEDGGFSTYKLSNTEFVERIGLSPGKLKGWCQSQVCVSALAYYFACRYARDEAFVPGLREYLLKNRSDNGLWPSYWWTSEIYATYFVLQGMLYDDQVDMSYFDKAVSQLVRLQKTDGSFACNYTRSGSAFYTALVLDLLCSDTVTREKYTGTVDKSLQWLLDNQFQDGSFPNTNFLAIPNPNVVKWNFSRTAGSLNRFGGGSSITGEQYSCYTTAVVHSALTKYLHQERQVNV